MSISWCRECFPDLPAWANCAIVHWLSTHSKWNLPCVIAITYSEAQYFPREITDCFARPVRATALDVPAGVASRTTSSGPLYCAPGGAVPAICDFMRGRLPSATSRSCTAECAATWICSAFRASMARVCSPGYFACFVFPRIGARPAGTVFSPSESTGELSPLIVPSIHLRKRIRLRVRGFSFATFAGTTRLTFFAVTV